MLAHISGQSNTFKTNATGENMWNRAITNGSVRNHKTTPAIHSPRTLCIPFRISQGNQPRFSISSRFSVWEAFSSSFQCGLLGAIQINPATHKNDNCGPA